MMTDQRCLSLVELIVMLKVVAIGLLFLFSCSSAQAVTCTSSNNGNWNQASRWNCGSGTNNGPPAAGDDVVINNHVIALDTTASARSVTVNGGTLAHSSSTSYTLTIANALAINGSTTNTGTGTFTIIAGSVTNNGTLAADIVTVVGVLTSNGSLVVGNLNVAGDVTKNSGVFAVTSLVFQGGAQEATFYGTPANIVRLSVNAGTSVTSNNYSNWTQIGDLINNGNFSMPNATVTLSGVTDQTIGGGGAIGLGGLILNKPSGDVTLTGDLDLTTALTLTAGRITTGNFRVFLKTDCGSGLTRTPGSWINGNLQLFAPAWGATCTFPVGDASNYAPISITYPSHAAPLGGTLTGRTNTGDHPDTLAGISGVGSGRSVNRYWTLTAGSGSNFYDYNVTLQYCMATGSNDCSIVDVDYGATTASFVGARKTGGGWTAFNPSATGTAMITLPIVASASGFGDFVVGESGGGGLTCINDNFSGGLNTALWNVAGSGFTPLVVSAPTVPSSRLRLTDNISNRATFAQVKRWFPAAGNMVIAEFDYYVYGGSGADGIAVVLSDASVPPSPGGYGGSLGYANRSGIDGFNGGWLGIGIDEFGNYPNSNEGRRGYPAGYAPPVGANAAAGSYRHSIAIRGSGVGQSSGYALLANTGVVSPILTTNNAVPHRYRITFDHSNNVNAFVKLERDTGNGYVIVVPTFDAKSLNSGQSAVPANFLLSFTGSTGGLTNFHELGNVQICATTINSVGNSTRAANFECLETGVLPTWSTTARHPLYTKITDANFRFDIVALKTDGTIENSFVAAGGNPKSVSVELFDDSATPSPVCSAYASPVASQTVQYVSGDGGRKTITGNFNLNRAWSRLRCRVSDASESPTVQGCSTDVFSVRPQAFTSVISSANADSSGSNVGVTPAIKAGAPFSLTANSGKIGYNGTPKADASKTEWPGVPTGGLASPGVGTLGGVFTAAASAATGNGASGNAFTYSEVGFFRFQPQGVYDDTFTGVSGDSIQSDCINSPPNDFSNTLVGGKYGCKFGNTVATNHFGRFIPDHFVALATGGSAACASGGFSYMNQPLASILQMRVEARNSGDARTQNYSGAFASGMVSLQVENANSGTAVPASRLNLSNVPAWSGGSYSVAVDRFMRAAGGQDGPFDALDIGLSVSDELTLPAPARPYLMTRDMDASNSACVTDLTGLSTAVGVCSATRLVADARFRYGRLWLGNAYGSEKNALSLPYQIQYWNGLAFIQNTQDVCTALTTANFGVGNYQGAVTATNLPVGAVTTGAFSAGAGVVTLGAPNAAGSIDVVARVTPALSICSGWVPSYPAGVPATVDYLGGKWCGATYDKDPVARATFGISRTNRQIYLREGYR